MCLAWLISLSFSGHVILHYRPRQSLAAAPGQPRCGCAGGRAGGRAGEGAPCSSVGLRPISVLRFWILEGLTQAEPSS